MDSLQMYETMSALSAQMVAAARANDWERLVALEKDCAGLARHLQGTEPVALSAEERGRKAELIRRILADDAEVRRHTEPWMEHVRQFLGGAAREQKLRHTYGAFG